MGSIFGLIVFLAGVWAIFRIWLSNEDDQTKILWTALVAILPVVGFVIWWFKGPKG